MVRSRSPALFIFSAFACAGAQAAEPPNVEIAVVGEPETIYDWSRDRCDAKETVDAPPRAFRDAHGSVHLLATHDTLRQFVGPSLDHVQYDCRVLRRSELDDAPERYADHQWLAAPYTLDGTTIFGLVHNEYNGHLRPALCPSRQYSRCWANSLTWLVSHDRGQTYQEPPPPSHVVAVLPYRYEGDVGHPIGYFQPSNIIALDGAYYALVRATQYRDQAGGMCVMRTRDLTDPHSWRAWDGSAFVVPFADPYTEAIDDPRKHLCTPLQWNWGNMGGMARDPASGAFVIVMTGAVNGGRPDAVFGVVAAASYDLVHWSRPTLVWADPSGSHRAGDPYASDCDASLLDPTSKSLNFDTLGTRPYVYFIRKNVAHQPYDRRLMRMPVRITLVPPK